MKIIQFIEENKEPIGLAAAGLYELVVRLIPTAKDWSIINIAKRLFDIIPNNKAQGGTH